MIEVLLKNSIFSQLKSFVFISAIYSVIYFFNNWATSFLYLLPGAHLVHIPTGFKLLFVLIAGITGALAIGFVSFINLQLPLSARNSIFYSALYMPYILTPEPTSQGPSPFKSQPFQVPPPPQRA